jgi:hypothetical protein
VKEEEQENEGKTNASPSLLKFNCKRALTYQPPDPVFPCSSDSESDVESHVEGTSLTSHVLDKLAALSDGSDDVFEDSQIPYLDLPQSQPMPSIFDISSTSDYQSDSENENQNQNKKEINPPENDVKKSESESESEAESETAHESESEFEHESNPQQNDAKHTQSQMSESESEPEPSTQQNGTKHTQSQMSESESDTNTQQNNTKHTQSQRSESEPNTQQNSIKQEQVEGSEKEMQTVSQVLENILESEMDNLHNIMTPDSLCMADVCTQTPSVSVCTLDMATQTTPLCLTESDTQTSTSTKVTSATQTDKVKSSATGQIATVASATQVDKGKASVTGQIASVARVTQRDKPKSVATGQIIKTSTPLATNPQGRPMSTLFYGVLPPCKPSYLSDYRPIAPRPSPHEKLTNLPGPSTAQSKPQSVAACMNPPHTNKQTHASSSEIVLEDETKRAITLSLIELLRQKRMEDPSNTYKIVKGRLVRSSNAAKPHTTTATPSQPIKPETPSQGNQEDTTVINTAWFTDELKETVIAEVITLLFCHN